jgi:hypothetical protein
MQLKAVAVAAACLCACAAAPSPTSADVYFRPFEATSFVRLTESIMVTSAGSEFHITDKVRLNRIRRLVDAPCQPSSHGESEMDLRLLIYFQGASGRTTWKASRFDFYDSSTGKMCVMTDSLRAALSKEFGVASRSAPNNSFKPNPLRGSA